jgi:hypothetical protein
MTHETHRHCQCDFCTGEDCGQDDPEKYNAELQAREDQIRAEGVKAGREEVLGTLKNLVLLKHTRHGCINVGELVDGIESLRSNQSTTEERK